MIVTVPNALSLTRLAVAVVMPVLAWMGMVDVVFWLLIAGIGTDWLDGKLAMLLKQRSRIGPILDTVADVCMYIAIVLSMWWLHRDDVMPHIAFIIAVAVSYAVLVALGWRRFGRWPSYHTRAAKTCWLLMGVATVVIFADGPSWPLAVALVCVVLANIEAAAITLLIDEYRDDVMSIYQVWRR